MGRSKKICGLLGVFVIICIATFAAMKIEEKKEQIKNSEDVILSVEADAVNTLSWSYEDTELAFHRDEDGKWFWDEDEAFPVSDEKMNELLRIFQFFSVSFAIEEVEDYSQYGLDEPVCTIVLTTDDASYTLNLGDFSKLDSQRYISIGDGNAYLVSTDPMDTYEITIRDMIENDSALDFDSVTAIDFSGASAYSVTYMEEGGKSYCADDVYFTQIDGENMPLDTSLVDSYLSTLSGAALTNYVSYNATEEELETYGLNDPEQTIAIQYKKENEDGEMEDGSYSLSISRSAEEKSRLASETDSGEDGAEGDETDSGDEASYSAYLKVGESKIIYEISSETFEQLMAASYSELRHQKIVTADFSDVTAIDISLEGSQYQFTAQKSENEDDTALWYYGEDEVDITDFRVDLKGLTVREFTEESAAGQEEISLTLHLSGGDFSEMTIALYRYDGESCLAVVNGEPLALVARSGVVDLMESVRAVVLN